jgi:hypothetical protein
MGKLLFYIDQFTDETMPCAPTLEGWAAWLNAPDPDDGWLVEPAKNGERFEGHVSERVDVVATWNEEKEAWGFDPPNVPCDWCAQTYGPEHGWDAEMIGGTPADCLDDAERDEPIDMAFMQDRRPVMFEFQRDEHGRPSLREVLPASASGEVSK